jgi:hydroxylysine kinase
MSTSPLGSVLTIPPPEFPERRAEVELQRLWGLSGKLRRLTSERDVNFHLETEAGDFVLKLAHPEEPAAETEFQILALQHLRGSGLPVPRMVPTRDGDLLVSVAEGKLRLLTYLHGTPLFTTPRSDAQRASIGQTAAKLARAFAGFHHPAARRDLIWDIRHAGRLRPLVSGLGSDDLRGLVLGGLGRFEQGLAPELGHLPTQVVHNDLNPFNVLVSRDNPDQVCGVLDFGDMVETPRLLDLGVASSYQIDAARPFESLCAVARAYHQISPLTITEQRLLPLAVEARLCTTLCITHERARMYPDNAAYISRNVPVSTAALAAMAAFGADRMADQLQEALR